MKIDLIAIGRLKKGAQSELLQDYIKRLDWPISIFEYDSKYKDEHQSALDELQHIKKQINPNACVIALDERGQNINSREFAGKIENWQASGHNYFQFIIGGANGLDDEIRSRADFLLSFGKLTWPHMLARVMLLEQIYRVRQIHKGHPYHKD